MVRKIIKGKDRALWFSTWKNKYFYISFLIYLLIIYLLPEGESFNIFILPFTLLFWSLPFTAFVFINRDRIEKNFPVRGWKWVFYIFGWLSSIALIFWIIQYSAHTYKNYGERFFTMNFHRRTYLIGLWSAIIIAATIFAILIFS